ncbi:MAG: LPS-assembly protein [Verrucomicrobiales bacterium]|jgi:LPS-assembly protein
MLKPTFVPFSKLWVGLAALFLATLLPAYSQIDFSNGELDIEADDVDYDSTASLIKARGQVHIKNGPTNVYANAIDYDMGAGIAHCRDNVSIFKDGVTYKGEEMIYNTNTGEITAIDLRTGMSPMMLQANEINLQADPNEAIEMVDGVMTTHDSSDPNYRLKAKKITVYPGEKIVFRNLSVYAGDKRVFWLPYLSQPLNEELGYHWLPGFRSNWGAFLLNRYGFMIDDHTLATLRLDLRSERGFGGGIDLKSMRHADNPNFGNFSIYGAADNSPAEARNGRIRDEGNTPSKNRYRVNLQHRVYLPGPDESTLYVDVDVNKISDAFFYEDFFQEEARVNPQPENLINLVKVFPRGTFSLMARFRANDFYTTDTRLPEAALEFTKAPIFNSSLFYAGETTAGVYTSQLGTREREEIQKRIDKLVLPVDPLADPPNPSSQLAKDLLLTELDRQDLLDDLMGRLDNRGFTRVDTFHEVSAPKQLFGWLSVVPKVGFRATSYSDIEGGVGSDTRMLGYAGIDTSFKLSKNYDNISMPKLGVDQGLRHISQPYVNYMNISGDDLSSDIGQIDRLVPSTKLRPIDPTQYTAIDSLQSSNILRAGIHNRLQTRRDGVAYNWLELNTYFQSYFEDPEFDRSMSNLYNDLVWSPLPWLKVNVESQLPVFSSGDEWDYTEINSRITFMPTKNFEFSIGDRFIKDHPFFEDSNLLDLRAYLRLSDRWGIGARHRYEFDDSVLELQQYTLHYNMTSWTAAFGALVRDNRGDDNELGLVFMLTLRDFPQVSLPVELDPSGAGSE